jgi:3-dehydroquinate dehydratase II
MRVLVLHGPNLNLLGDREPDVYGTLTLDEIERRLNEVAESLSIQIETKQSNQEGELVELVQGAREDFDAIVINPGGYSHTSVAIRDAIAAVGLPTIAVHLSNPSAREWFRQTDVVAGACVGVVAGFGWRSYAMALEALARRAKESNDGG